MVVREARRCGGKGWQAYDSMFRQLVAKNSAADWSVLNTSLYATTFLVQVNGRGRSCQNCMETDHASGACALAPLTSKVARKDGGQEERRPRPKTANVSRACWGWNEGKCAHPYGRYKHVCQKCGSSEHREPGVKGTGSRGGESSGTASGAKELA